MALLTWTISLFTYFLSQVKGQVPYKFFYSLVYLKIDVKKIIDYVIKCVPYKLILP